MPLRQPGDVLIRSLSANRFELVDVVNQHFIDGPFDGFQVAVAAARLRNVRAVKESDSVGTSLAGNRRKGGTRRHDQSRDSDVER